MSDSNLTDLQTSRIEMLKLNLERARYRAEIIKWVAVAIGATVSFAVIDYGKLRLEKVRLDSDNQLRLIEAYSKATEAAEPEIWKRKLDVLQLFATDDRVRTWVKSQVTYIDEFAALDALYRETLKTASQLVDPALMNDSERTKARRRFEQLYWADLPFAGESDEVVDRMVSFRKMLLAAEKESKSPQSWESLNQGLINLSETLKRATRQSLHSTQAKGSPER